MTWWCPHCTSVFFRKSNFHTVGSHQALFIQPRHLPQQRCSNITRRSEDERFASAVWWGKSQWGTLSGKGWRNISFARKILCHKVKVDGIYEPHWILWNLFKTKIRRVELSPTISQIWKMFRYEKFHLWGVVFLIQPRTVHREQTLQSSMAIPKKRKETKMLQTCMTSISRSLVGESNPSMETSTRVFLSLQTP